MVSESVSLNWARKVRPGGLRSERGAAVFIVVMVLTLLTAVGIFAVRSASLADMAAGYDREGSQAALVAQYGITATTANLARDAMADLIIGRLTASITSPNPQYCESNGLPPWATPPPAPRPPCFKLYMSDLQDTLVAGGGSALFAPANLAGAVVGATSSLNPNETTNATFVVEITESARTGGLKEGGGTPTLMTLTAISQVNSAAACAAGLPVTTAGQQVMRAMITAGTGK